MWITFTVMAALTWYNPSLGGINCDDSCDLMAAGHPVDQWYDRALACPIEFPIGTEFIITNSRWGLADGEWTCLDRGGRVLIDEDGVVSLDLLRYDPVWRETVEVVVKVKLEIDGLAQGIIRVNEASEERDEYEHDAKRREELLWRRREGVNDRLYRHHDTRAE